VVLSDRYRLPSNNSSIKVGLDTLVLILLPALDAERKKSEAEAAKLEAVQKEANELRQSYMTAMAHLREYQSKEEQNQTS
jgi:hypothetical protein